MKIVIIGAGNVAQHLGQRLKDTGHQLVQLVNRSEERGKRLASKLDIPYTNLPENIFQDADLYIIAVSDDAIKNVAASLSPYIRTSKVIHTSGSTPSWILKPFFEQYGVFYPLQTFTAERAINFAEVPICVYSKYLTFRLSLIELANGISNRVYEVNDRKRAVLHVAAVMVNNFTNHLYAVSEDILEKEHLDFEILEPLIQETVSKIKEHRAEVVQTGPAQRGDRKTINRHLRYLKRYPAYHNLYRILTESIRYFKNERKKWW